MQIISTLSEYEHFYQTQILPQEGKTLILVPTMGALHEGHGALIRQAADLGDEIVVSIFVNPLQFGPNEDLSRYPRPLENDLALCRQWGATAVFTPTPEMLYPHGLENITTITPPDFLTNQLCGASRPGHFSGVATIVFKLFQMIRPHKAVFGEKDAQQLQVIRQMVQDLDLSIDILSHPIVREKSGLALSSRNRYLQNDQEREAALCLHQILNRIREIVQGFPPPSGGRVRVGGRYAQFKVGFPPPNLPPLGGGDFQPSLVEINDLKASEILSNIRNEVLVPWENGHNTTVAVRLDYLEAVDRRTFEPVETLDMNSKVCIAVFVNQVRLIDNMDMDELI